MSFQQSRLDIGTVTNLPPVTVVIINWNYGRYLPQAIRSVLAQDYPNIDCIIVDNGSTDDSVAVISELIAGDSRFQLIELDQNYGQLGALFKTFGRIRGPFVVFLDADDILLSSFVSTHVQVHLALPKAVAMTSANVLEINAEGQTRSGSFEPFGSPLPWNSPGLSDPAHTMRVPSISDEQFGRLSSHVTAIPPRQSGWFWSPGSANMYRRSVIEMVWQSRTPEVYLRAADAYLNPLCHALGGSALIDVPLSLYRIHDKNYCALWETLPGVNSSRPEFRDKSPQLTEETIDFMLSDSKRFQSLVGHERFWEIMDQLSLIFAGHDLSQSPAFARSVARHIGTINEGGGEDALRHLLGRLRIAATPPMLKEAWKQRLPSQFFREVTSRLARRVAARVLRRVRLRPPASGPDIGVSQNYFPPKGSHFTRRDYGPIAVISHDPPIIKTGIAYDEWIGIAGAFGRRFGNIPAAFLIYPTWSIEDPDKIAAIGKAAREHRKRYPDHRLVYMGNTQLETDRLTGQGLSAIFLNKNFTVSDDIFRPLPDEQPEFDAIYNARFVPEKRYELAGTIESLAYIGYLGDSDTEKREQMEFVARLAREHPNHVLLNPIVDGQLRRLSQQETNQALNRARIGLCLSEVEGTNYASMEYMLAGLGVVSTPSRGGRDVYFDDEFCIVCEPDAAAVKKAVAELKARQIPREYIRQQTLARIRRDRMRFLELAEDLRGQLGGTHKPGNEWPFGSLSGMVTWDTFDGHLQKLERDSASAGIRAQSAAFGEILKSTRYDEIQLEPAEMLPVVRAILAVTKCRLLIFGCGNDSPFWEQVNRDGRTTILEDDQTWIDRIAPKLTTATIEKVTYGTRVADWPALLDAGDKLMLELPDHVAREKWDVIVVDGPPGHGAQLPGRAQSIVTASRLVAPGGKVFVHDCERPLEREFTARYLGEKRRFVSVSGRALLNGYAF